MLTASQIISLSRLQTWITTAEVSDSDVLLFINQEYPKIMNKIYFMDKNYWYSTWKTDIIDWQNVYSLLEPIQPWSPWWPVFGQQDIEKVKVKLDPSFSYYYECKIVDFDNFDKDMAYYEQYQPKNAPMVIIMDRQIKIFPKPDEDIADGLILEWTKKPYQLISTSTSADIIIPEQYQDILVFSTIVWLYRLRVEKYPQETQMAQAEYDRRMQELLYQIAIKTTTPITWIQNDLSYLN